MTKPTTGHVHDHHGVRVESAKAIEAILPLGQCRPRDLQLQLSQRNRIPTEGARHDAEEAQWHNLAHVICPVLISNLGMLRNHSETAEVIHRLKEEIDKLTEQQAEALRTATYLGMTTDEAKEYEQRREKILDYVKDLKMLEESL